MADPLSTVVEGYSRLASRLLAEWTDHASNVAAKLDADAYDADRAAADLAKTFSLATESWFLLASEALDAAAILSSGRLGRHVVRSGPFVAPSAGAALEARGPFTSGHGHQLPAACVRVEPPQLGPGKTEFGLCADATGCRAGTYVGEVVASTAKAVERVVVWITVP
jgi:hypothetical protein